MDRKRILQFMWYAGSSVDKWILATGLWRDEGEWQDDDFWND